MAANWARIQHLARTYAGMRAFIQGLGKIVTPVDLLLDVGCGEGFMSTLMAKDLKPTETILLDMEQKEMLPLPPNTTFQVCDVCSPDFLAKFQGRPSVVTSICAFHEFLDQPTAATNLLGVLPIGGATFILDRPEEGWIQEAEMAATEGPDSLEHYQEDLRRMQRLNLHTNAGIRAFWEGTIFPRVPGLCALHFHGAAYTVFYLPRQWGEVKQFPHHLV